jgi:hypothetical protein
VLLILLELVENKVVLVYGRTHHCFVVYENIIVFHLHPPSDCPFLLDGNIQITQLCIVSRGTVKYRTLIFRCFGDILLIV